MKRFISVAVAMLLILSAAGAITAGAEDEREKPYIYLNVSNPDPKAGESVSVTVYAGNAEGLIAISFGVRYNAGAAEFVDYKILSDKNSGGGMAVTGKAVSADNLLGFAEIWIDQCYEKSLALVSYQFTATGEGKPQFTFEDRNIAHRNPYFTFYAYNF